MQPDSPDWTSQVSFDDVASLLLALSVWAVLMCLFSIATEYDRPLEAAHAHIDDGEYDKVGLCEAGQPRLYFSGQL